MMLQINRHLLRLLQLLQHLLNRLFSIHIRSGRLLIRGVHDRVTLDVHTRRVLVLFDLGLVRVLVSDGVVNKLLHDWRDRFVVLQVESGVVIAL